MAAVLIKRSIVGPWKSWKIKILFGSLVNADDKARSMKDWDE